MQLRDYQQQLIHDINASWTHNDRVVAVLPTGGGKTVVLSEVVKSVRGPACVIAHRREIVSQLSEALGRINIKHRIIAPADTVAMVRRRHLRRLKKSWVDQNAQVAVASVQSLTSKSALNNRQLQSWVATKPMVVLDECHHYVTGGLWWRAVEMFSGSRMLGVTATPQRADGKGIGVSASGFAEDMLLGPDMLTLIDRGFLTGMRYYCPESDLDMEGAVVTARGDYSTNTMRSRVVESSLVGDVVKHYRRFCPGKRAIVFATDVKSACDMEKRFSDAGIAAAAVSGATDQKIRDRVLEDFECGNTKVLINVDLFDEGFDVPACDAVILARPTESLGKYLQMCGRALRTVYKDGMPLDTDDQRLAAIKAGPKPHAIIIDPVRNRERHGPPIIPRVWTLEDMDSGSRGRPEGLIPERHCTGCAQPYPRYLSICPWCSEEAPPPRGRSTPEQVDGDLTELDMDALRELIKKAERAAMTKEEYEQDQMRRGIPKIGRTRDMRRHLARRVKQGQLDQLVKWWTGSQPKDRDAGEKQRRFYHRFGVDMATARTLNEQETTELIDRILNRFGEDMI